MRHTSRTIAFAIVGTAVGILLWMGGRRWPGCRRGGGGPAGTPDGALERWAHWHDARHRDSYTIALERLALGPEDSYLDSACGSGALVASALETVKQAAGIDRSEAAVEVARETNAAALAAGRVDLRVGDAADLPWETSSFDAASNLNTLHVISDPTPVLREAYRVLRPGGRYVLVTQAPASIRGAAWSRTRSRIWPHEDADLAALMRDIGFVEVSVGTPDGEHQVGFGVKPESDPNPSSQAVHAHPPTRTDGSRPA